MAYKTWAGTTTAYKNLHRIIGNNYGRPLVCDDCGDTGAKRYEWANISGRYLLKREDWKRLCVKCHRALDKASYA